MSESTVSPILSVITVVYNGEAYLEKTIQSVLGQSLKNIEMIIVDGGSTDGTLDILKKYHARLRWISEKDKGIYDAMNKGLAMAKGEWINFLNGGDLYCDESTLSEVFRDDSAQFNLLYGDAINYLGTFTKYITAGSLSRTSLRRSLSICHQAIFVRKKFTVPYDLSYRYKAEYNWIIDIVDTIPEASIHKRNLPVVYYLLGGFSERGMLQNLAEYIRLIRNRFGWPYLLLNLPTFIIVFLRFVKYRFVRPGRK